MENEKLKVAEELTQKIRVAFADNAYPGDANLARVNTDVHCEYKTIRVAFRGRDWRNLDDELAREAAESLFFFSARGFQFFLPGLMLWTLTHYARDHGLGDSLVYALTPLAHDSRVLKSAFDWIDGFNMTQRQTIREYLQVLRDHFAEEECRKRELDEALRFWNSIE